MSDAIVLATGNPHKRAEIVRAVGIDPRGLRLPHELGSDPPDPVEDGETYLANAIIKATAFSRWAGLPALADDTGLEVAALDGAPGILSARYSGPAATYADNVAKLLAALAGRPRAERAARFVTVLALCRGAELLYQATGVCTGHIASEPAGDAGFGYDPVFVPEGETRTFAELTAAEKDRVSHRGRALERLRQDLAAGRLPITVPLTTS